MARNDDLGTTTGYHRESTERVTGAIEGIAKVMGFSAFSLTALLIAIDTVLNPIFMFAQASASGIHVGTPLLSWSWWIIAVITLATSGVQYALFDKAQQKGMGKTVGWVIVIIDTLMDGGGFAAWVNKGDLLNLSGDASNLQFGVLPAHGSGFTIWFLYLMICAICMLHEPFLQIILGRFSFEPVPGMQVALFIILQWIERAGKMLNVVRMISIPSSPIIILALDVMLFSQSAAGHGKHNTVVVVVMFIMSFVTAIVGFMCWDWWNHIRQRHSFSSLSMKHKGICLGAITATVVDSFFDLKGFNEVLYGQSKLIPTGLPAGGIQQWFLTGSLVMVMVTMLMPLFSDVFLALAKREISGVPGDGVGFDLDGPGGPGSGPGLF